MAPVPEILQESSSSLPKPETYTRNAAAGPAIVRGLNYGVFAEHGGTGPFQAIGCAPGA
jgi:hypothetical protein